MMQAAPGGGGEKSLFGILSSQDIEPVSRMWDIFVHVRDNRAATTVQISV